MHYTTPFKEENDVRVCIVEDGLPCCSVEMEWRDRGKHSATDSDVMLYSVPHSRYAFVRNQPVRRSAWACYPCRKNLVTLEQNKLLPRGLEKRTTKQGTKHTHDVKHSGRYVPSSWLPSPVNGNTIKRRIYSGNTKKGVHTQEIASAPPTGIERRLGANN